MYTHHALRRINWLVIALLTAGCGGDDSGNEPNPDGSVVILSGNNQSATAGTASISVDNTREPHPAYSPTCAAP